MKIVFNQILVDRTNNEELIKQYEVKAKKAAVDKSTKWIQKEVIDFNPERFESDYPDICEMFPDSCVGSNNSTSFA